MSKIKKALICGISGQDGTYLAKLLLEKGYEVHGTARDAQVTTFPNLIQLGIREKITCHSMALNDFRSVLQILAKVQPDEIYNLAGQSSVGLSFEQPVETLESVSGGTLNLLEAIRFLDRPVKLYNAGSSECLGNTDGQPADENTPFRPRSPYAVAKAPPSGRLPITVRLTTGLPAPASFSITNPPCAPNALLPRRSSRQPSELRLAAKRSSISAYIHLA